MSKHEGAIKRWKNVSPAERSIRMRKLAITKHKKLTREERSSHAKKMAVARWKKAELSTPTVA